MVTRETQMYREIREIPDAVERLLTNGRDAISTAASEITRKNPAYFMTVARGSSDHAATYFKYAAELLLGLPVASVGPSVASIYDAPLKVSNGVCISVSQSGKSPDIVELSRSAGASGALTCALTNFADSDLAKVSDHTLLLHAGEEKSVAATKTFVTSLVNAIWLLAEMKHDDALLGAIHDLPQALSAAIELDWEPVIKALDGRNSLYCLGRGPAYAIGNETALKFKETCQIHAEAYSSAEVLHGPVSIVDPGFPVLALTAGDKAEAALVGVADQLSKKGANVFVTSTSASEARSIPRVSTGHPLTDPISLIASFYAMVNTLATQRGINPDTPRHLKKVTETV